VRKAYLLPTLFTAAAVLTTVSSFASPALAGPDDAARMAEVGLGSGFVYRRATSEVAANPGGISYGGSIGVDAHARVYIVPWLRIAMYYVGGYETIDVPHSATFQYDKLELDHAWAFSLGGRLEPTWHVTDRFRAFAIIGAGWGRMKAPTMKVQTGSISYQVERRAGVWVEYPLGLGATFDVLPNRLGLSFETTIAPHTSQSGDLFDKVQYVDSQGVMGHVDPMPTLSSSLATMLNVVVLL
jgi:hypothetical protein